MNRSRIVVRSAMAVLLLFVSGCSIATRTIDVAKLGPINQVQVYRDGGAVLEHPVVVGSAEERTVTSWLRSHATGWRSTAVTYAPGRRVRGENFDLNFGKDKCVLNYRVHDKGDWVQVARPIDADDPIPDVFALGQTAK